MQTVVAVLVLALVTVGCDATESAPSPGAHPAMVFRGDPLGSARETVRRLSPDLREAVTAAAEDALDDGVVLSVTSGWRSRAHQERLFTEAVAEYGSGAEALRHVATPDSSAHVTGDAVDVGPAEAAEWLGRHGSAYGLCQAFANERWHFELLTDPGEPCPPMLPDNSYR